MRCAVLLPRCYLNTCVHGDRSVEVGVRAKVGGRLETVNPSRKRVKTNPSLLCLPSANLQHECASTLITHKHSRQKKKHGNEGKLRTSGLNSIYCMLLSLFLPAHNVFLVSNPTPIFCSGMTVPVYASKIGVCLPFIAQNVTG